MDLAANYFSDDFWHLARAEYNPVRTQLEVGYLVSRFSELAPNLRLLDLCCGEGRHAKGLAEANFQVEGLDINETALAVARQAAPSATFRNVDVFSPGWPTLTDFGGALLIQSCGWTSDGLLLSTLRRIRRSLAHDGVLVLDVSVSPWIHRNFIAQAAIQLGERTYKFDRCFDAKAGTVVGSLRVANDSTERDYPHNVRIYDLPVIQKLLVAAGFSVIEIDADFQVGHLPSLDTRYAQLVCQPFRYRLSALRQTCPGVQPSIDALDLTASSDEPNYAEPSSREGWSASGELNWDAARAYYADDPFGGRLSAALSTALDLSIAPSQMVAGAGITSLLNSCARFATGRVLAHGISDHPDLVFWAAPLASKILNLHRVNSRQLRLTLEREQDAMVCIQRPPMLGPMIGTNEIKELAEAYPRAQFIVDEAYLNYSSPGDSAVVVALEVSNVLVLSGLSKGYGAGGLRVGFAISSAEMLADLREWVAPLQLATPSANAACEILRLSSGLETLRARTLAAKRRVESSLTKAGLRVMVTSDAAPWICCYPGVGNPVGWFADRKVRVRSLYAGNGLWVARLFPPLTEHLMSIFELRVGA